MKAIRVGGPLLGGRSLFSKDVSKRGKTMRTEDDLKSWTTFEPIITPLISNEQFILLPNERFVTVLAYKTGRRVATFIPLMERDDNTDSVVIQSACVATFAAPPSETLDVTEALQKMQEDTDTSEDEDEKARDTHILLVGCRDGTIREFDLSLLTKQDRGDAFSTCGQYDLPGPCHRPRRFFSLSDKARCIKHLAAPSNVRLDNGALLYVLLEKKGLKPDGKSKQSPKPANTYFQRIVLPSYRRSEHTASTAIPLKGHVQKQARIECRVGYDKQGVYHNTTPFRLLAVAAKTKKAFSEDAEEHDVFVIVARCNNLHVYHEIVASSGIKGQMESVDFTISDRNPLSAVALAPNGTDIACGYAQGDIRVMSDALPQILNYFQLKAVHKLSNNQGLEPKHPVNSILSRRVHWHAHAVASLSYQGLSATVDPMLYSGGYESVLVTWQLSKGTYRPADVLPRLAKGSIVHVSCSNIGAGDDTAPGILVYCEDNSLQLFQSHNKSLLWKVQALATFTGDSLGDGNSRVESSIRTFPLLGANTLIVSGLPAAPGYLHWYDTCEQRVTAQLEVAPFNRVSRTEHNDSPMPVPSVTNCAISESGKDLVTLDTIPTENGSIGAPDRLRDGAPIGVVSTLRFWSWNPDQDKRKGPYTLTAAMAYPHGKENRVTAVALSKDGQYACTVSNDENAFRLWHRVISDDADEDNDDVDKKTRRTPAWVCRYKVTTPSGYSSFGTTSSALDFSSDGSILAICYGHMITLWDQQEATLLTALQHLEHDRAPVESLSIVKTGFLHDMILTKSRSGVTMQSPYGTGQDSWSCSLPVAYKDALVTHAEVIPSHDLVAVCLALPGKARSQILLLDAITGSPRMESRSGSSKPMMWELRGAVRSLGVHGKPVMTSRWVGADGDSEGETIRDQAKPIQLFVMMNGGDMLLIQSEGEAFSLNAHVATKTISRLSGVSSTDAPRLNMLKRGACRKRRGTDYASIGDNVPPAKKIAATSFGTSLGEDNAESAQLPSSDLPSLGGAFTRAFVCRHLATNKQRIV